MPPANRTRRPRRNYPISSRTSITIITGRSASCPNMRFGAAKNCHSRCNSSTADFSMPPRLTSTKSTTGKRQKLPTGARISLSAATHCPTPRPILGSRAFGFTLRSTGAITTTKYASFLAQAISVRWQRGKSTACPPGGWRSTPATPKGRNSPCSRHSGSKSRHQIPTRLWCTPCSTVRVPRRPIASRFGPATPRCSTWKWRSIRASI